MNTPPPSSSVFREHMLGAVSLCPQGPVGPRPLPACLFMTGANWTGLTDGPLKLGTGKGEGERVGGGGGPHSVLGN